MHAHLVQLHFILQIMGWTKFTSIQPMESMRVYTLVIGFKFGRLAAATHKWQQH